MRIAHLMVPVTDLEQSLDFYTRVLEMDLKWRREFPDGRFTLAWVGFGDDPSAALVELTQDWDTHEYERGKGCGHLAIEVDDVEAAVERVRERGGVVTREPAAIVSDGPVVAFIADPDGYPIEFLPRM